MSKIRVHTEFLNINWKLIGVISEIDRYEASWKAIERREGQSLKELKSIAMVRSVGASIRIEGSKLTDEEVDILLKNMDISKLQEREPLTEPSNSFLNLKRNSLNTDQQVRKVIYTTPHKKDLLESDIRKGLSF